MPDYTVSYRFIGNLIFSRFAAKSLSHSVNCTMKEGHPTNEVWVTVRTVGPTASGQALIKQMRCHAVNFGIFVLKRKNPTLMVAKRNVFWNAVWSKPRVKCVKRKIKAINIIYNFWFAFALNGVVARVRWDTIKRGNVANLNNKIWFGFFNVLTKPLEPRLVRDVRAIVCVTDNGHNDFFTSCDIVRPDRVAWSLCSRQRVSCGL